MTLLARAWIDVARARRRLSGDRRGEAYAPAAGGVRAIGLTEPLDPAAAYGSWWWGITPSALRGMLSATGSVVEELRLALFLATAIARPV
jgi:hypothetical protein